ncbi:MAG: twitching motility protein PilT [Chloroflexi bacterium]|nr:twitching motility protein PilT [Chloroflexota bacterium]
MVQVWFWVKGELQDFLAQSHREQPIQLDVPADQTIKHVVEHHLGIPHPEVAQITLEGYPVNWRALPRDGATYVLHPYPPGGAWPHDEPPAFVLDGHLGRLAAYLRLLGYDVLYSSNWDDATLAGYASQGRVLLTRDQGLLKRRAVKGGYWVRALEPEQQLAEVVQRYALWRWAKPFSRCPQCNTRVHRVPVTSVAERVPADVRETHTEVHRCPSCGRIYWRGSHVERLLALFRRVRALPPTHQTQNQGREPQDEPDQSP